MMRWGYIAVGISLCFLSKPEALFACESNDIECLEKQLGMPEVDAAKIQTVDLQCASGDKEVLGEQSCKKFYESLQGPVAEKNQKDIESYYDGNVINWITGETKSYPTPVCNLQASEEEQNRKGQSCGDYCHLKVSNRLFNPSVKVQGPCEWEKSHYRGAYVQVKKYYQEQVFNELHSNKIQLVDFEGVRPCAEIARDVMRFEAVLQKTRKALVAKFPATADKKCESKYTDITRDPASHSVCLMEGASNGYTYRWQNLLTCEVNARVQKDFLSTDVNYSKRLNIEDWMDYISSKISKKCKNAAKDSDSKLNKCYHKNLKEILHKKMEPWNSGHSSSSSQQTSTSIPLFFFLGSLSSFFRRKKFSNIDLITAIIALTVGIGCDKGGGGSPHINVPQNPVAAGSTNIGAVQKPAGVPQLADAQKIVGGNDFQVPGVQAPSQSLAATAADKLKDSNPFANKPKVGASGADFALPTLGANKDNAGGSAAGTTTALKANQKGGQQDQKEKSANNVDLGLASETLVNGASGIGYEGSAGSKKQNNGSGGGQDIGDVATGAGESISYNQDRSIAGAWLSDEDFEDYLSRVGAQSLFEVTSQYYYGWTSASQMQWNQEKFNKIKQGSKE